MAWTEQQLGGGRPGTRWGATGVPISSALRSNQRAGFSQRNGPGPAIRVGGGSGGGLPGGGGPIAGAGGGGPGGALPGQGGFGTNIQANPYLDQVFGYFGDLWKQAGDLSKETYNTDVARQGYIANRAQGLKELQAGAGRQGFGPGTGLSIAGMQNYGQGTERGAQELEGNLWNAGLNQRTQLLSQMANVLGGMGGVGNNIAQNQLGLLGQGLEQQKFGLDAWYKANMLPIEMEKAKQGLQIAQLQAVSQLAGML